MFPPGTASAAAHLSTHALTRALPTLDLTHPDPVPESGHLPNRLAQREGRGLTRRLQGPWMVLGSPESGGHEGDSPRGLKRPSEARTEPPWAVQAGNIPAGHQLVGEVEAYQGYDA